MNLSQLAILYLLKFYQTYSLINSECIDLYFKLTKLDTTGQKCDDGYNWKCDMWFRAHVKDDENKSKDLLFYNGNNQETLSDNKYRETENLPLKYQFSKDRKEVDIVLQFADEGPVDIEIKSEIRKIFQRFEENENLDHVLSEEIHEIWQNTLRINLQNSLEMKQFDPEAIQPNKTTIEVKSSILVSYGYELEVKNNCSTTSPTTTPLPTTAPITTTMTETTTVIANKETMHSTTITSTSILTQASSGVISTVPSTTETTQNAVTLSRMPSTPTIVTDESDYSGTTSGKSEFSSSLNTNQQTTATNSRHSIFNYSLSTAPQSNETTRSAMTVSRNSSTQTAVIDQSGYFNGTTNGTVPSKQDSTGSNSEEAEFPTAMLIVLILFILLGVGLVLAILWHDKLYDTVVPLLISANPVN